MRHRVFWGLYEGRQIGLVAPGPGHMPYLGIVRPRGDGWIAVRTTGEFPEELAPERGGRFETLDGAFMALTGQSIEGAQQTFSEPQARRKRAA